jgi:oligoribonuclease (3'-5' exoribonuclease)
MPRIDRWLHYRNVDVSSIKELSRRWYPRAYFNAPAKDGGHRALADIRESIRELAYYREARSSSRRRDPPATQREPPQPAPCQRPPSV